MFELGDAHRSRCVPESVFGNDSILRFAEDKTDAWLVVRMTKEVIDSGEVEVHLPGILGFKPAHFEIDDNEASELQVVEEQIDLEILSSNLERHLTSDEGKSHAEFDEKLAQVRKKPMFEVALLCLRRKGEEIEIVRIFDELLGEIRLCRWQSRLKVRERLPLPPVKATLNLHDENVPAPAVGGGLFRVPEPFLWTLHQVKEPDIVAQGNCATGCCTIGQASANARMYLRFLGESPRISGNSTWRSLARRSMTFAPQPSSRWRARICFPIPQ